MSQRTILSIMSIILVLLFSSWSHNSIGISIFYKNAESYFNKYELSEKDNGDTDMNGKNLIESEVLEIVRQSTIDTFDSDIFEKNYPYKMTFCEDDDTWLVEGTIHNPPQGYVTTGGAILMRIDDATGEVIWIYYK